MKTHVKEWKEVQKQGILVIAFYVLLMAGFFIVSGNSSEVLNKDVAQHTPLGSRETAEEASDKSFGSPGVLSEKMMANVYEALIPAEEPSISFSDIHSIRFPSGTRDKEVSTWEDNHHLTLMLMHKNKEVAEECNTYWNLKECLKEESEQPLNVETWMTDDKFWHPAAAGDNINE